MSNYKISQSGLDFIKLQEGCKLKAYLDSAGILTIGVGHTGPDVRSGMVITEAHAMELLLKDVEECEKALNQLIKVSLTQNQVNALCSFTFNVGVGALTGSTLLRKINEKAPEVQIRASFLVWNKATVDGKKVPIAGLTRRRQAEADLYYSV